MACNDPDRIIHETHVSPNEGKLTDYVLTLLWTLLFSITALSSARDLFHELGHVTHALLSSTGLQHLSGANTSYRLSFHNDLFVCYRHAWIC